MLDPNRSLVMVANTPLGRVSVAIVLEGIDEGRTRLISRLRASFDLAGVGLPYFLIFEPGDFVMMRRMLLGIKERAERTFSTQTASSVQEVRVGTYRPTPVIRYVNRIMAKLAGLGLTPQDTVALRVRGRHSGRMRLSCSRGPSAGANGTSSLWVASRSG